ncbi:hypothetical protein [Microbacterium halotolerans]|uniref:hypothetical protein n=1 Tax=Microbacterium halotolerans TaxID=246613 RepID=UPI000E6A9652|nr:hypothetical protein [Microbacterium halotolerans]
MSRSSIPHSWWLPARIRTKREANPERCKAWCTQALARLQIRLMHELDQHEGAVEELSDLGDVAIREAGMPPLRRLNSRTLDQKLAHSEVQRQYRCVEAALRELHSIT